MSENLRATQYSDGTPIDLVEGQVNWASLDENDRAYCWSDDSKVNNGVYGILYTWAAATNNISSQLVPSGVQGVCPDGWHIPSEEEWQQMETFLGLPITELAQDGLRGTTEGGKLKETGTLHWISPNTGATNETGFSALPAGIRYPDGLFNNVNGWCGFWTATELASHNAYDRLLYSNNATLGRQPAYKVDGMSVRCVKDL